MSIHDPNADRERIAATRIVRETANSTASHASRYLQEIAIACSIDGENFALLQQGPQNLGAAITLLASVRASVDKLEALLPEIVAEWRGVPIDAGAGSDAADAYTQSAN